MLRIYFLAYQLLLTITQASFEQTCIWKSGEIATGHLPCDSLATNGTCCSEGSVFLASGLCYGNSITYGGACINTWNSSSCLTICDDISDNWANIYRCSAGVGFSSFASTHFWCGSNSDTTCSSTNGIVLSIVPGLAIKILTITTSSATAIQTSVAPQMSTTFPTSLLPTSSMAEPICSSSSASSLDINGKDTVVGIGVGVPLGVMAAVILGFYFNERSRKKLERALASAKTKEAHICLPERPQTVYSQREPGYPIHSPYELMDRRSEPSELSNQ